MLACSGARSLAATKHVVPVSRSVVIAKVSRRADQRRSFQARPHLGRSPLSLRASEDDAYSSEDEATSTSAAAPEAGAASPIERARAAAAEDPADADAITAALGDLEAELNSLREAAAAAEARAASLEASAATAKDQLLRLSADFENFRRRTATEKDEITNRVRGDVVGQLLPLVDNFELARTQVKAESEGEIKINNSYQSLYKQMVDMMRGLGVEAVPTTGTPFDPMVHEAIMQEPSDDVPDGTVLLEFRKGFKLGDKLLRPAMVKVSTGGPAAPAAEAPAEAEAAAASSEA